MGNKDSMQLRGNCMRCGRDQAVVGSVMADHGYTINFGWRAGPCPGSRDKPMQGNPALALDVQDDLRKLAEKEEARVYEDPAFLTIRQLQNGRYEDVLKPWAECGEHAKNGYRTNWASNQNYLVGQIRATAEYLRNLAATACYQPLREVLRKADRTIKVGSMIKIDGEICEVKAIRYKVAHGVGPAVNGTTIEHCFYVDGAGRDRHYPKRYCRLAPDGAA